MLPNEKCYFCGSTIEKYWVKLKSEKFVCFACYNNGLVKPEYIIERLIPLTQTTLEEKMLNPLCDYCRTQIETQVVYIEDCKKYHSACLQKVRKIKMETKMTICEKYGTTGGCVCANKKEQVNHPAHYGGEDNVYETIKVIEAWQLNFNLGNAVKYISRATKKDNLLQDLKKAAFYLNREIAKLEKP